MFFDYNSNSCDVEFPKHTASKGSPLQIPHIIKIEGNLIAKALSENTKWNTFVDVGASEGLWTINMAKYFDHVIAIEPYPKAYELLKKNTQSLPNVTLYNIALAKRIYRKYVMLEGPSFNIGMTKRLHEFALLDQEMFEVLNCKTFTVEAITLDSLKLNNVSMIKIDVEGEEKNVLKGGEKTIAQWDPYIIVDE